MKQQPTRDKIDEKYKWDLTPIFPNIEAWEKEFDCVKKELPAIGNYKGKLTSSAATLLEYLSVSEKIKRRLWKLYYYAHLNFDSDTTNQTYQVLKGKIEDLLTELRTISSYTSPELLETDYEVIKGFINELDGLKEYAFSLENFYRYQSHKLSEQEENVLALLSNTLSSPEEIYESLTDSDMKFGNILDSEGNEVEFTESKWSLFCRSKDRKVRKEAFELLYNTYSNFKNTIANTFSKNADYYIQMAKLHKFNSSLEASLFDDAVDRKVYDNLIDTINNNLNVIYKYYGLKKEILGLDELHLYDTYVDLIDSYEKSYEFEEAKKLVLEAMKPLGEDYIKNLNRAFSERWIDIYNNKGKRGGAYSSGFYDINPYVLLNYEGKFEDVSTLAHELGHSMHSLYSWTNQSYENSSYQIFVAEVASTVNELLLRKYMLKNSTSEDEKKYILNSLLELFKSTIYRQVMFAEFERNMHADKENGEVLTNEYLSDKYYELNKKYFGDNVVVDDLIKYEWMRIPHFYYDFYVYKYAIGLSCACFIVNSILDGKEGALEGYKAFLSAGGSKYPADELKLAGIDVTSPEVIESAIKMFDETIDEFKSLIEMQGGK